jgi:hypothetical protein
VRRCTSVAVAENVKTLQLLKPAPRIEAMQK